MKLVSFIGLLVIVLILIFSIFSFVDNVCCIDVDSKVVIEYKVCINGECFLYIVVIGM